MLLFDIWDPQFDQAEVVHYFSVQGGSMNFCGYVKRSGYPIVISPILWPRGDTSNYPMAEIRELHRLADLLFPNSQAEANLLAQVFDVPLEKFHVTYNGVDDIFMTDDDVPSDLFCEQFTIEGHFLLCVGNIEERKNQVTLARALRNTEYSIVLIGNIRDEEYLKETFAHGNRKIRYLGYLKHDSVLLRSAYKAC